jgi:hypothetical protein
MTACANPDLFTNHRDAREIATIITVRIERLTRESFFCITRLRAGRMSLIFDGAPVCKDGDTILLNGLFAIAT